VESGQVIFHSSLTTQSYARQLSILTNQTEAFGAYSVLNCRLIADWSIENEVTPYRMLVYYQRKHLYKRYKNHLIFLDCSIIEI
jgi:hypothetical protein